MQEINTKTDAKALLAPQSEKPAHYTYLKEFRTQQCPLFLLHKCTQHRPYTCFNWHFANQRRRRPLRRKEGTFNYTPDKYCGRYDETTGLCPDGDDCPLLHRNCGDTERRYHVRYYKTATCVHETDNRGVCTKNGPHCAFAHGTSDLRNPTFDVEDIKAMELGQTPSQISPSSGHGCDMTTSAEKEKILNEDPKWNDSTYVLANYKTEPCKRPPRLCRQGYACPQYHNNKDRRRNPQQFKYRSTPCPQVKQNDEWGDPAQCSNGDNCTYCHTRTEQQFYPEIYKSSKCKDMVQNSYCPRGPFCAFAHVDQEMNKEHTESPRGNNSLGQYLPASLIGASNSSMSKSTESHNGTINNPNQRARNESGNNQRPRNESGNNPRPRNESGNLQRSRSESGSNQKAKNDANRNPNLAKCNGVVETEGMESPGAPAPTRALTSTFSQVLSSSLPKQTLPAPIGKGRSMSVSETARPNYTTQLSEPAGSYSWQPLGVYSSSVEPSDSLFGSLGSTNGGFLNNYQPSSSLSNHTLERSIGEVPNDDTVESVIGGAMDDLHLGDFHLSFCDDSAAHHDLVDRGDTASVCSSQSAGLPSSYLSNSGYLSSSFTLPVKIPEKVSDSMPIGGSLGSLSQGSPLVSPFGSQTGYNAIDYSNIEQIRILPSPRSSAHSSVSYSQIANSPANSSVSKTSSSDPAVLMAKLREENQSLKEKLHKWEESTLQARGACDAWRKEAEEFNRKYQISETERVIAIRQRDEAVERYSQLKRELEISRHGITRGKPGINLAGI